MLPFFLVYWFIPVGLLLREPVRDDDDITEDFDDDVPLCVDDVRPEVEVCDDDFGVDFCVDLL